MLGSKSRTRKAELASIEADKAAQVAAEKALAAEQAQEAARDEIRAQRRAEREQALADAKNKAQDLLSEAQSKAAEVKDRAQSQASEAADRTQSIAARAKDQVESKASDAGDAAQSKAAKVKKRTGKAKRSAKVDATATRFKAAKVLNRTSDDASDAAASAKAGLAGVLGSAFASKSDVSDKASAFADVAGSRLSEVRDRARDAYQNNDGLQSVRENAVNAASEARQRVAPHVEAARDRGLGLAAPHVENVAAGLQPHVDAAHDKVVDEILPRIMEAVSAATAAAGAKADTAADSSKAGLDEVAGRAKGRTKAAKKAPSQRKLAKDTKRQIAKSQTADNRGGGHTVLLVGAIGAGAVAAYAAWKANQPSQDPWAVATAATQPSSTGTTSSYGDPLNTTTTAAAPADTQVPTTGPMAADGLVDNGYGTTAPQAGGFGVDSDVAEGTMDDVRPEFVPDAGDNLPVDTTLEREGAGADIHQDLLHTDLPQRAPVQAREPFGQDAQPATEAVYYSDEQATENVHLDDDALQQFRRNRGIDPNDENR